MKTENIRVKGKNSTRLYNQKPKGYHSLFLAALYLLVKECEAPCLSTVRNYVGELSAFHAWTEAKASFVADPESFFQKHLETALVEFEANLISCEIAFHEKKETKWLADYEGVFEIILPKVRETVEHSDEMASALLEFTAICLFVGDQAARLLELIPWFIRYGSIEDITQDELLNKLAPYHHDEYIARLPGDELFEFLTSENDSARIRAKNKVQMEVMGEFDEA